MKIILEHYKCPSLNIFYGRGHWTKRAEMMNYAHQSIKEAEWILSRKKPSLYGKPVSIIVTAYLKRPIDCDNVSCKGIIDGLKLLDVIIDDSPKYITEVTTRVVKSKKDYTIIEIYEKQGV